MSRSIIGLEVTEAAVRAVEIAPGSTAVITSVAEVALPPGAARDAEVVDAAAVTLALKELWSKGGFRSRRAVLALGGRRLLVRDFSAPDLDAARLRAALPFQAQDVLPMPVEQAVLDFYPISRSDGEVHGLLVAAVADAVEGVIAAASAAGIDIFSVDAAPFGLARVQAALADPADVTSAIAYIGEHTTIVVVVVSGIPRFVRIVPIDLPDADEVAAEIAERQAEEFVSADGSAVRSARRQIAAIPSGVADVASRLRSTLSFFENRPNSGRITSLTLTGPGSTLPLLDTAITVGATVRIRHASLDDLPRRAGVTLSEGTALNSLTAVGVVLGRSK